MRELERAGPGSPEHRGRELTALSSPPAPLPPPPPNLAHKGPKRRSSFSQVPSPSRTLPSAHVSFVMGVHLHGARVLLFHLHLEPDALVEGETPAQHLLAKPRPQSLLVLSAALSPRDWRWAQPTSPEQAAAGHPQWAGCSPCPGSHEGGRQPQLKCLSGCMTVVEE